MNYSQLLEDVRQEVTGFFESHHQSHLTYHNLIHTESVVERAGEIARYYQLGDREYFIVVAAAWFHDAGYYLGEAAGHEKKGAELATSFLRQRGVDEETAGKVSDCIMATCMPQSPHDLLEKIVADADLYHWGTDSFPGFNSRMRKEASWRLGRKIDKSAWRADTIRLLESHEYKTDYARELLEPVKQHNIELLRAKQAEKQAEAEKQAAHEAAKAEKQAEKAAAREAKHHEREASHPDSDGDKTGKQGETGRSGFLQGDLHLPGLRVDPQRSGLRSDSYQAGLQGDPHRSGFPTLQSATFPELATASGNNEKTSAKQKEKKVKTDRPERGIETMFRISSNNHQRLSDMADNKANIMITTTSIILSVLLSVLLRKLEDNPHLIIPTLILLLVCVITMVFSILATRPSLPGGTFTRENIDDKKVNLLFFGNFYRMAYEDYETGMQSMMNDRDFLYGSLTRDVYSQGVVLGRKYRLLRIAYNVFMFGVIVSVLAFITAVTVNGI